LDQRTRTVSLLKEPSAWLRKLTKFFNL